MQPQLLTAFPLYVLLAAAPALSHGPNSLGRHRMCHPIGAHAINDILHAQNSTEDHFPLLKAQHAIYSRSMGPCASKTQRLEKVAQLAR